MAKKSHQTSKESLLTATGEIFQAEPSASACATGTLLAL